MRHWYFIPSLFPYKPPIYLKSPKMAYFLRYGLNFNSFSNLVIGPCPG